MQPSSKINTVVLELDQNRRGSIKGLRSLSGTDVFQITYDGRSGYVPRRLFVSKKLEARGQLHDQNVFVTSDIDWRAITKGIEGVRSFKAAPLIDAPGWADDYFARNNGKIFGPAGQVKGIATFKRTGRRATTNGSFADWMNHVAVPLTGQHLPIVAVLAAFAAPLLECSGEKQNFGLELCGPPATGKTTWLKLMASIAGSPEAIPTFNATKAGLETMFAQYHDMPFPVDEANLADGRDKQFLKDFSFRMANGTVKLTAFQPDRAYHRFVFATTANRPFSEALRGIDGDTGGAALQRLISLRIDQSNPLGIFTFLPEQFASSGELARYLIDAIHNNYGAPMRKFLRVLVNERATDRERFRQRLRQRINQFETWVGVAAGSSGTSRASAAFGLLYAAGCFAKTKGVLPTAWDCKAACLAAYRNYVENVPDQIPLVARLLAIATMPSTLDLRGLPLPQLTDDRHEQHGAFINFGVHKRTELLLTEETRSRFFPDWAAIERSTEFVGLNLRDGDHATKQRRVRADHPKERFFCFRLPPEVVEQLGPLTA